MSRRRGVSMLEVVLVVVVFVIAMAPISSMMLQTNRVGAAASKVVAGTAHGQVLIQSLQSLPTASLPLAPVPEGVPSSSLAPVRLLWDEDDQPDGPTGAEPGGSENWQAFVQFYRKDRPFRMRRTVTATRLRFGEVQVRVDLSWPIAEGRSGARYEMVFHGLVADYAQLEAGP